MNTAVLAFGSNAVRKADILRDALSVIDSHVSEASDVYFDDHGYANIVAAISTDFGYEELRRHTKELEVKYGRKPSSKAPEEVALDIDIVIYNGEVVRPADFAQPYFIRGYRSLSECQV
ncbi:MAG: 2-amino-4-hydroxy-6-hydroxymethyldihydropteridine diphosphokinase [Muribaculaceae bacterium]|nr:2-amino-4-hydroxy-6-hydroxymethyldihydropteridine diphosphokinase [Muribaculaceae bacterium]MDE6831541.1 2-amino-4-hydroxy-6-hydroxymethyldihydropteridine diphosphokinase [Muribaculaceae bacterium]